MKSREAKITQVISNGICVVFTLCALLPFILLFVGSFTDNAWALEHGFTFFPQKFSVEAYRYILDKWQLIGRGFMMTIIVAALGTAISLGISTLFAYGISKSEIPGMKLISFLLIFTMLFNGGLVSTYYCYVNLYHIKDTVWALIVPNFLMNAFNVILIRNYFVTSIPASLEEAARIDGATEYRTFSSIVLPLSKPIMATIGLLTALTYWNDWTNGLYYLSRRNGAKFYTIQNILNNINENLQSILKASTSEIGGGSTADMPSTTIRMAIAVVGILPVVVAYPFFQKYFVKGITLGGVKE
ncbi:MAG: carbohydrate ABC transporter permease [Roseburia sp.]|jgi:putative aldouronate transport system permease protein|nr:carbohydrate ABC transporter permease [Roseburia sp.]